MASRRRDEATTFLSGQLPSAKQTTAFREASAPWGVPIAYVEAKPRGFASTQ